MFSRVICQNFRNLRELDEISESIQSPWGLPDSEVQDNESKYKSQSNNYYEHGGIKYENTEELHQGIKSGDLLTMISAAEQEHQCMDTKRRMTQKQRSPTLYQSRSQKQQKITDASPSQELKCAEVELVREKISGSYYIAEQKPPVSLFAGATNDLSDCASSEGSHSIKTNDEMSLWNDEGQFSVMKCPSILRIPFETGSGGANCFILMKVS